MQFVFHGAGKEVGRSCISINGEILLDAGLKITESGTEYPSYFDVTKIKNVLISHAHLDHTGALSVFNHAGLQCPIYATKMTKQTTDILLQDSFHIELLTHTHPGYSKENIRTVLQHFRDVEYNKIYPLANDCTVQFLDAGHIPGSASILLTYKKKKILYSGDVNWQSTFLLEGAHYNLQNVDVMITECTYGDRGHPDRKDTERRFLESVQTTLNKGGSVLLPAFAVGRAQELIILLSKSKIDVPIYLDGMARKVTDLYLSMPQYTKDAPLLKQAKKKVQYIMSELDRKKVLEEPSIIITTSGMVTGGPVMEYLKMMFFEPKHTILLTGYQGDGTNGRLLLTERCAYIDGKKVQWTGTIEQFDFSAHAGQSDLLSAVQRMKPKVLILNHGDEIAIQTMLEKTKKIVSKVYAPNVDEVLEL